MCYAPRATPLPRAAGEGVMINERAHLLDRCLRLEARVLGIAVEPLADIVHETRRSGAPPRRKQRSIAPADIALMRDLRARGLSYHAIAQKLACADATVRTYVLDVQVGR